MFLSKFLLNVKTIFKCVDVSFLEFTVILFLLNVVLIF